MAKKAATKPAAKKRPAKRKPVEPAISEVGKDAIADFRRLRSFIAWRRLLFGGGVVAGLAVAFVGGAWSAGGWQIGPGPVVRNDVLQQAYDADRATQVAVLRDLAKQPFDGTTDDGRKQAGEWFNAQRFRNRPNDYGAYTDRVSEAIAANAEDSLANELEAK